MISNKDGFTLLETIFALVILAVGILGMTSLTGRLSETTATAEERALALQAVEDRLTLISADPRYAKLDSIYEGEETGLPGLPDYTRTTLIERFQETGGGGGVIDRTRITVLVEGRFLAVPIVRTTFLGAP